MNYLLDLMKRSSVPPGSFVGRSFAGLRVEATSMIPEFNYRWEFPYRRFVQFEKKDEWWARKMGFGREVKDRVVYQIGDVLFMHPKTLEAFNAAANLQTARPQA